MKTICQIAVPSVLDGNQTLVKTATGVWQVTYNGENRPVRWERGSTVVTMDFDSMGRRTFSRETENGTEVSTSRFFYDGYLMIQQLDFDSPHAVQKEFIWDPTEPVATKPLVFRQNGMDSTYLTHDGNKNVADVIRAAPYNDSVGHYEYAPFGAVTSSVGSRAMDNPFRFSSEYADDTLGLDYYNYRHYEPETGRWTTRDCLDENDTLGLYVFCRNSMQSADGLGMMVIPIMVMPQDECAIRRKRFMTWYEAEKKRLSERDENGENWVERLPHCPSKLLKRGDDFISPDENEWTKTWYFGVTQFFGNYHPHGVYELRTKDPKKYGEKVPFCLLGVLDSGSRRVFMAGAGNMVWNTAGSGNVISAIDFQLRVLE